MDLLHQLRHLNQSSLEFPDQLTSLLHEQGYPDCVKNLQGRDLAWLVEYLDNALSILYPASPTSFRICLRELSEICGSQKMVPQSYMLPGASSITIGWPTGSRGSSDVYEGVFRDAKVCVKQLRIYSNGKPDKATQAFFQEAVVWKCLTHPNIVPFLGITIDPLQSVSVWMPGGELLEYISTHPSADRLALLSDVAGGLSYLHSRSIIHGDLKGPSILVDDTGHARLTDFGLFAIAPEFGFAMPATDGHAVRWAAPEILDRKQAVSKESDVFSFAMVVIEIFTGEAPFYASPPTAAAVGVLSGKRPARPTDPSLTDDLWDMTKRCWNKEPHRRPDIAQVVLCLRKNSLRRGRADTDDSQAADDVVLSDSPRRKDFWFSRHKGRQTPPPARRAEAPTPDGAPSASTLTGDNSVIPTRSLVQPTRPRHYWQRFIRR